MQRSPLFPPSIPTPPTPQPFPPLDVHSNIHFSFCSPPISVTSPHLAVTAPWHGDRLNWKVFVHRGPSEHDASQRKKKKKLILILSIHTGRHGCAPLSLVVPEKKNSAQTLAWSFEKAPFTHNETICARVCRCKRWRRTLCSRISVHARLFCRCACLCIC